MFENVKSAEWFENPKIMGEVYARRQFEALEEVVEKYAKSDLHKAIVNICFPDVTDWHVWCNWVSNKRIANLRYVLRRVEKAIKSGEFFPLFYNIQKKHGYLKTTLLNVLEYIFYQVEQEAYEKLYARQIGFYGLSFEEAKERLAKYVAGLQPKLAEISQIL